ncbi:Na+/H+ antiporter NhaC [Luminiphilus syltensis NOR5-1B]|uniref:Na+/H+ antiporter NhaC n=1 Tax=Luminiphilus syltensis NOR5-1B TaxID=565045 RepID=B8KUQ6_9GAMM|nr:Na+/H+ antiporter NhaC [Luminiphilus syltensis]EED35254.1 Na+/H+ antiporter NhaC [Luminiphilus syltensis NOR5-1B]
MLISLLPIALLVGMLFSAVQLFGSDASYGPNQIALVVATGAAALVGLYRGQSWDDLQDGITSGIRVGLTPTLILLAVGALIGSWIIAGTVPAMIYYGVALLNPDIFYAACAVICAFAAVSIGSSWTVAGTLGIGLVAIANSFGMSPAITAGAIIAGAYFGDKLSPLSDTTNLAAACAGVDLFSHIKHMLWTTVPAFTIAMVVFLTMDSSVSRPPEDIIALRNALDAQFGIGPHLLIPLAGMLLLVTFRVPAYPAILLSTVVGCVIAAIFQPEAVKELTLSANPESTMPVIEGLWMVLFSGYVGTSADPALNELLSKGGMASMLNTVWLIITALGFGGILERTGILKELLDVVLTRVKSTGDLVLATITGGVVTNMLAADQFLALALPGRLFTSAYDARGLSRLNLSRSLEDSATLTSVLIPWNTCGAYMSATLGVATIDYLPYTVFNYVCPLIAILLGYLVIGQKPAVPQTAPA